MARRFAEAVRRLGYGLFVEKRWRVAIAPVSSPSLKEALAEAEANRQGWTVPALSRRHSFHADPFFLADGTILVEAMRRSTGKGEILHISGDRQTILDGGSGHFSYPCPFGDHVVPETVDWGSPHAYRIAGERLEPAFPLDIDAQRLIDPTLLAHDGRVYLFGNCVADGTGVLHLWHAAAIDAPFVRHPASPIRVSGVGSRMAGPIGRWGGALVRFGQDWRRGYGDGVIPFRIEVLTADHYAEVEELPVGFASLLGPHTVDYREGRLLFDYYEERLTPMAGVRRLAGHLRAQRPLPRGTPLL